MAPRLHIEILGPVRVELDGEACSVEHDPLRTRAQRPASSAVPTVAWATTLASTAGLGARSAWGSEIRIRSCDEAVALVDQPAEQIPPTDITRVDWAGDRDRD